MKATKIPTDSIFSDKEMKCLSTYNERQSRQYLASKADSLGCHGVSLVCEAVGVCRDTMYRARYELYTNANDSFPKGRIRAVGGKSTLSISMYLTRLSPLIQQDYHKTILSFG